MRQNYFTTDGKKYYTGSILIVNNVGQQCEATFICYDTERNRYIYKINDCICHVDPKTFQRNFICVTDKVNLSAHMPIAKTKKDNEIDGLFIGWLWYIFLMAISTIFKGALVLWILFSIVFFGWRKKKIKEEGTYIEW